jgi:hypothetical protein
MIHPAVQDVLSSEIEGRRTPIARPVPVVFGARVPYRIYDDAAADDGAVEAVPQRSSELGHEVQAQPISSRTFFNLRRENLVNMMREKHFENVIKRRLRELIRGRRAAATRKRKRGSRSHSRSRSRSRTKK